MAYNPENYEWHVRDTIYGRIVEVRLKQKFVNNRKQDDLATKVLVSATTDAKTVLASIVCSDVRQRNYRLAHRILYERDMANALEIHRVEAEKDSRYLLQKEKLVPFLESVGVK
jgi:hypothetical protein